MLALMPHGVCYVWDPGLVWLHALSDGLIALAYFSIPTIIGYLLWQRRDFPFRATLLAFALFIFACGLTHVLEVISIWSPVYWLSGFTKAATALISIAVATMLWTMRDTMLKAPTPETYRRLNEELDALVKERTSNLTAANERLREEIAQRRAAEDETERVNRTLANHVAELRTLLDLLPVGIAIKTRDVGVALEYNRTFADQFELPEHTEGDNKPGPQELLGAVRCFRGDQELTYDEMPLVRCARQGTPVQDEELRVRLSSGTELTLLVSVAPITDVSGNVRGSVGTFQDITRRKQEEADRLQFERSLHETQKLESLGVLAGGIAHDFNNLLTGILGHSSLIRLDAEGRDSATMEALAQIETSSERAADLCRQLMAYAGKGKFEQKPFDLSQLVTETGNLLDVSVGKVAQIKYCLDDHLPAVMGDPTQIRQVLMNLVINASEAVEPKQGQIFISTTLLDASAEYIESLALANELNPGRYVSLEVQDNGKGMDEATRNRIFDPFFTTKFTGRGLGLAAVQGIVHNHGGGIRVYSEPGRGTLFKILLPPVGIQAEQPTASNPTARPVRLAGNVLVIDDEIVVRKLARNALRHFGLNVEMASSGAAGLELVTQDPAKFDLVMVDLTMPMMDGDEVIARMGEIAPDLPIVMMSGFNEQDTIQRVGSRKPNSFLSKPFSIDTLIEKVRPYLREIGAEPPSSET